MLFMAIIRSIRMDTTVILRGWWILTGRADIYVSGHDHDMQHLKPEGNLHFFVAGSGGKLRPITAGERSLFARSALGFAVLEANHKSLTVTFIEKSLTPLYEYTLTKEESVSSE
jgi:tartrate-resistant acid phosphatase type 5